MVGEVSWVASSLLSWVRKTTEMEEGFQNSCLGSPSHDAEGQGAPKGGHKTDPLTGTCQEKRALLQCPGQLGTKPELEFSFIWLEFNLKIFFVKT